LHRGGLIILFTGSGREIRGDSVIMKGAIVTPLLALYPTYTHKTKLASMSLSVLGDNTCPEKGVNACLSI